MKFLRDTVMTDKVLITNAHARRQKYGTRGYLKVRSALRHLIIADAEKGLKTLFVDISNRRQMKRYRSKAVLDPRSEFQNKNAVDLIYEVTKPHYLVLIGGPDIIPHVILNNPIQNDIDKNIPSDLPYASDEPFSNRKLRRNVATYAEVTRVLGRIPDVTGSGDVRLLVSQIMNAAGFKSRKREDYLSHFAISAYLYRKSTEQSVDNIFRHSTTRVSPPTMSQRLGKKTMAPLSHFINCDGVKGNSNFYGRRGNLTVISMTGANVAKNVKHNTIVAAECCYGAHLFDPGAADGNLPMANAYLKAGAIAFFGSTNVAYGSRVGNEGADLIAQYFLIDVLGNASVGRACLQARQRFVQSQKMENPVNLKTLAQFILLGDPSLQPVRGPSKPDAFVEHTDLREARQTRRVALVAAGRAAFGCSGFPGTRVHRGGTKLHEVVRKIACQRGFSVAPKELMAYDIAGGENYAKEMKARNVKQRVFVATDGKITGSRPHSAGLLFRVLVAHAQNQSLTDVIEYVRR
jgi:hypothetical protein